MPSERRSKPACARRMLSCSDAARSCWRARGASGPRRLRITWAATTRPCARRSRRSTRGTAALRRGSHRPRTMRAAFDAAAAERLRALLHRSPRTFGKPTSVWTLDLAAAVSFERGLTAERVSDETIRLTLKRLGIGWKRAKRWITSPDPEYARKKVAATA